MNDKKIWDYLIEKIGNPFGVAGLMGNLYAESALNPRNLQQSFERKLGMTDDSYTQAVDYGTYTGFVRDGAGYGLAQWTYWSRKEKLLTFAKVAGKSIGDLDMQLDFLWNELQGYSKVLKAIREAKSVRAASDAVLTQYERPANQSESVQIKRASFGQKYFDKYASGNAGAETSGGEKTVAIKRMPIAQFVKELEAALKRGDGYIMGSRGQNPRTGYLDLNVTKVRSSWKENGYYFTQYSGKQRTQALTWRKKCTRVWDCNGMAEGIYELFSGVNIDSKARYNYSGWCGIKGKGLIPAKYRVPGAAVFWSNSGAGSIHHVAYLYKPVKEGHPEGDWYIIEAKGVMYGVVKSKLYSRKPNFWGIMDKYFDYSATVAAPEETTVVVAPTLGSRVLKNGSEGEDVKQMQTALIRLGYDLGKWGTDGDFGDCTEAAVEAFQLDHGIKVNGKLDAATLAALEAAITVLDTPVEAPRYVVIEGGKCYVRTAPNTSGDKLGVAHEGDKLLFGGQIDEETRWLLVQYTPKGASAPTNAWVSGKYGRLVE